MKVPNHGDRVELVSLGYLTLVSRIDKVREYHEDSKTWKVTIIVDDVGTTECIDSTGLTYTTPEVEVKEKRGSIQWELVK